MKNYNENDYKYQVLLEKKISKKEQDRIIREQIEAIKIWDDARPKIDFFY